MFRSKMLRWHTFRVVLLTSIVWILFGFGVLIYYMDTSATIAAGPVDTPVQSALSMRHPAKSPLRNLRLESIDAPIDSDHDRHSKSVSSLDTSLSPLAPYREEQLRYWTSAG